jgi:hypothetical protein
VSFRPAAAADLYLRPTIHERGSVIELGRNDDPTISVDEANLVSNPDSRHSFREIGSLVKLRSNDGAA